VAPRKVQEVFQSPETDGDLDLAPDDYVREIHGYARTFELPLQEHPPMVRYSDREYVVVDL